MPKYVDGDRKNQGGDDIGHIMYRSVKVYHGAVKLGFVVFVSEVANGR